MTKIHTFLLCLQFHSLFNRCGKHLLELNLSGFNIKNAAGMTIKESIVSLLQMLPNLQHFFAYEIDCNQSIDFKGLAAALPNLNSIAFHSSLGQNEEVI